MATNLNLTSEGCSVTLTHFNPSQNVYPTIKVDISLTVSLQLTVKFYDIGYDDGYGGFNYDMGFVATGADNSGSLKRSGRLSFGSLSSGNYGWNNSLTLTADLSSYSFPITINLLCAGCDTDIDPSDRVLVDIKDGSGVIIIYDARHTHISAPAIPTISSTTGKTITVAFDTGSNIDIYSSSDSTWRKDADGARTYSGLTQGTSYTFRCREYCDGFYGDSDHLFTSGTVTGKTWNISGSFVTSGAKSMVFKATHVAGTGGTASARTITYKLYTTKSTSGTLVATKTGSNGIPVTFTDLDPGKTYYCYAYTTGITDNDCWIEGGSTKTETTVLGNSGDVSATTLRASVSWNAGGATSVVCIIQCNGSSSSLSSSSNYVGFTGLTPGSTYTVSWTVTSTYRYTYTYTVIEDGEEVIKTGTITDVIETTGSTSLTTKKAQFGSPINITSKIIQFKSLSNYSSDMMEQRVSSNTSWDTVEQDTYFIYNNLAHNTSYTIYARIAGCYAFNSSGNETSVNDSEISQTVYTKLLSLSVSISEEHQHSLVTLWQAYVDGIATDSDAIDGTVFEFTYMDTLARKNNPPYQSSEVIEGSNGSTTGDYQLDKKIYSNNLTWYYCEYIVTASITDGYNIVAAAITAHTIFPAAWIFSGGQWHRYMGHVYTNSKYVPAPVFIDKVTKFAEPNGE